MELSPLGAVIPVALGPDDDMFHLEFELLGNQLGQSEPVVPSSPPAPVPDVMEPDLGLRTFAKINDTMSALTGIDANDAAVVGIYNDLRSSLRTCWPSPPHSKSPSSGWQPAIVAP